MIVICPCGLQIPSSDMNLANMVAKCPSCNSLLDLHQYLEKEGADPSRFSVKAATESLPVPAGWTVARESGGLEISWRWFSATLIFMALFCVVWDSFLVFWYSIAITKGELIMMLFPLVHVAVGVGLTYSTLAGFLNKTVVKVAGRELTVKHGPVPWFGNRTLNVSELADFKVQSPSFQAYGGFTVNTRRNLAYRVNAITRSGTTIPLLTRLSTDDQAQFVVGNLKNRIGS